MKKGIFALVLVMLVSLLAACGNDSNTNATEQSSGDDPLLSVVTSFYPIYYMTKEIGGEHVNVTNLIASGVEPHDWSPKSKDLLTASNADLMLYHGAGFETWIDHFKQGLDKDSKVIVKEVSTGIALIDTTAEQEQSEAEHVHDEHDHSEEGHSHDEHGHSEDEHSHDDHGHHHAIDPHTWVSPKSALILAENIKNSLIEIDADNQASYEQNFEALKQKIVAIDEKYETELHRFEGRPIVVSHQSFGYVARDYHLKQVSIMGLSPNAEPRAQDIKNLANLVKSEGVKVIFFEELVSDNLAKMLAAEAKVDTNVIYSLEGLTTKQEKNGEDYLSLMERNLQNIIEALQ